MIKAISTSAEISWPESVELQPLAYIEPIKEQLNEAMMESNSLCPMDDDDLFETILGEKREVVGKFSGSAFCYRLPKDILLKYLKIDENSKERNQYLLVWTSQGEFEKGDKVRFRLSGSEQKDFKDVGACLNIYVDFIEKFKEQIDC